MNRNSPRLWSSRLYCAKLTVSGSGVVTMIETGAYGERMAGYLHLSGPPDHAKLGVGKSQVAVTLALVVSRPAQRLLTLWPARSPSRHRDPLHRRLQRLCHLRRCFDCYRVERTSSRAGLSPAVDQRLFTAHVTRQLETISIYGSVHKTNESSCVLTQWSVLQPRGRYVSEPRSVAKTRSGTYMTM